MATRLILYDFGPEERPAEGPVGEDVYFPAQPLVQRCLGCFGCWVNIATNGLSYLLSYMAGIPFASKPP